MSHLFYGVAYYDEYMPEDWLAKDIALMRETGINVVRIAESTWSTLEPEEGQYNFYHIDRVLEAMHEAGIAVIVGTPTYAVPPGWRRNIPIFWSPPSRGSKIWSAADYGYRQPDLSPLCRKNYPHADGPCATPSGDYRLATG